ncbi:MAG: DUF5667 domain-containing protein [Anaerolineae bacterium]|nr:DUF5667 domain-containing protein [Anaerolineae bacterium]
MMRRKPEEELDPHVRLYLEALRSSPPRDPRRAARTRAQFIAQAVSIQPAPRHKERAFILFGRERRKAQILAALFIVVAALGGFTGTLYAAQDDLPGQALYPLKTWSEDVQVALMADPDRRVERLMDLAQRRVEEVIALTQAGQEPPEAVLQRMEQHFYQAMERAAARGDDQMIRTLARIQVRLRAMQQVLAQAPQTPVRERVWARLEAWRRLAGSGETNPAQFRQQIRERVREQIRETAPRSPEPRGPRGPKGKPESGPSPKATPDPGPKKTPGAGFGPAPTTVPGTGPGGQHRGGD